MSYPNLKEALKMCGSAKKLGKIVTTYEKTIDIPDIFKLAKESDWKKDPWIKKLETKSKMPKNAQTEATITIISHPDLGRILREVSEVYQLSVRELEISILVKAKSHDSLKYCMSNPYILAQISAVGDFAAFKCKIQTEYLSLVQKSQKESKPEEEKLKYINTQLDKLIGEETLELQTRAGAIAEREFGLPGHIKWKQRERWISGTLNVLGSVAAVGGAVFATGTAVMSMGGTAIGAGLAIHSAAKSLASTAMTLHSFVLGYEKSLSYASADLEIMALTVKNSGAQKATGSHVLQAAGALIVGDFAEPYKNAGRHFDNADFKLGQIELKLQDMGYNINKLLNECESMDRLLTMKREALKGLDDANEALLKQYGEQVARYADNITNLQGVLNSILVATVNMSNPIQESMKNLEKVRQGLKDFAPTKTASGLVVLTTLAGAGITGGLGFAANSSDLLNLRIGNVSDAVKNLELANTITNVSLTLMIAGHDVARNKLDSVDK
jgi:hypothetical protein